MFLGSGRCMVDVSARSRSNEMLSRCDFGRECFFLAFPVASPSMLSVLDRQEVWHMECGCSEWMLLIVNQLSVFFNLLLGVGKTSLGHLILKGSSIARPSQTVAPHGQCEGITFFGFWFSKVMLFSSIVCQHVSSICGFTKTFRNRPVGCLFFTEKLAVQMSLRSAELYP